MEKLNINDSHLGLFETATGKVVNLEHPSFDMIEMEDIATALSNICRFGGHVETFYSVAQHSVLVALLAIIDGAPLNVVQAALMHDAAEAYLGDVIKPLKIKLGDAYREYELEFEDVIFTKFEINEEALQSVKVFDKMALELEYEYLRKNIPERFEAVFKTKYTYPTIWDSKKAKVEFLKFYKHLFLGGLI